MRKSNIFFVGAMLLTFTINGLRTTTAVAEANTEVYIGGMSAGFTLKTDGAQVIGLSEVLTEAGICSPASSAGLHAGDIIQKVAGVTVDGISELNEVINKSKGKEIKIEFARGSENLSVSLRAAQEKQSGRYKIGVLVRENISGIGTVTYIDKQTGKFGALGHPVASNDNQEMKISKGIVYECNIIGVSKGVRGKAGELRGMFLNDKCLGNAEKLSCCGIFGQISEEFVVDELMSAVANSNMAKPGSAYIYSTINGVSPKRYEIEIVKVDKINKENKNFVIKITDDALIAETGGIVQGMSGSPILQEGRLIGAVTHVFLNDPTRGYGIEIEKMLNE